MQTIDEVTLGFAEIRYTMDDNQYYRVSTVVKKGNWKDRFIWELENFIYNIELKSPISLEFNVFIGSFINNKSNNLINTRIKVI